MVKSTLIYDKNLETSGKLNRIHFDNSLSYIVCQIVIYILQLHENVSCIKILVSLAGNLILKEYEKKKGGTQL
jgi:hypothetical protein